MTSPSFKKSRLGVLISGNGSNLQALIDAAKNEDYPAAISVVLGNKSDAYGLERARQAGIPAIALPHGNFANREDFDRKMIEELEKFSVDLVVLAGFMRLLTPIFIQKYSGRLINIHPSLLPAFPGTHAIEKAFQAGVKQTGVTVHFVDEGMDTGPVILQKIVEVEPKETLETLTKKVHSVEHALYPEAVRMYAEGRLHIKNHKVIIT